MADSVPSVVHVVDADDDVRRWLVALLGDAGVRTLAHPDAPAFLGAFDPAEPAVMIVDVGVPDLSGFRLQEQLSARGYPAPVVFCSAHGDIPMTVRALRSGAVDFLEKPFSPEQLLAVVHEQIALAAGLFDEARRRGEVVRRLQLLTPRERQVLRLVVNGRPSQLIARELGTSVKTVDVHRTRIKAKTQADSLTSLVRDVLWLRVDA
jgi:two-component system response regulator FixJ